MTDQVDPSRTTISCTERFSAFYLSACLPICRNLMCLAVTNTSALTIRSGGMDTSHDFLNAIENPAMSPLPIAYHHSSSSARQHHQYVLPRNSETVNQIFPTRSRLPHPTYSRPKAPFGKAVKIHCLQHARLSSRHRPSQRSWAARHNLRANIGKKSRRLVLESARGCEQRRTCTCAPRAGHPENPKADVHPSKIKSHILGDHAI